MKLSLRMVAFVILMSLTRICFAAPDKVLLVYKAQAGQSARYKQQATLSIDLGGTKGTMEQTEVDKVTFTDVAANGNITMQKETESSETTFNGEKAPEDEDKSVTTLVIRPDGTFVSFKRTGGEADSDKVAVRLEQGTDPVFSEKAVGVGDKWSHEYKGDSTLGTLSGKADFEVLALETKTGVKTAKIKMDYAETEGSHPMTIHSVLWIELSSGDVVSADLDMDNVSFSGSDKGPFATGKVHGDRISGAPLKVDEKIADTNKPADAKPADTKPKEKTVDETVKDFEKLPGLFTVYRKKDNGRETIYLEIKESQLDKLMLMEVTASTGTSAQVVAGDPLNDIVFKFSKIDDDRLFMMTPNINFRADEKTPIARAVKRSFADGILESFKIEAKQADRKSILINISELFRGDVAGVSQVFSNSLGGLLGFGGGSYGMDREKTYIASLKNFPENLVVETAYHFVGRGSALGSDVLADPRSVPLRVNYTVFALPDNGYKPRLADPRVGYFLTQFQDMNNDHEVDTTVRYIYRWDLQKSDPKAALSPPKKPIVFWMDNAIPVEYRDAVRDGLLMWNKGFEKVGFKDAIVVKQMPDNADWDHADMRYNTIRWVASPSAGYAVAQARVNPLTGQILNANITVDANFVRYIKLERQERVNPAAYFDEPDPTQLKALNPMKCEFGKGMMEQGWFGHTALEMLGQLTPVDDKAYLYSYLREVVCHEMGHIMGLRHNFVASTYHTDKELQDENVIKETGISSSVMEYGPFNIFALKHKGVEYYSPTIGPYDMWAIRYGYAQFDASTPLLEKMHLNLMASSCNTPGHAYESDESADQWDPNVVRFDLGRDPLVYWNKVMDVSRYLMLRLDTRLPKQGDSYYEFTRNFESLIGRYSQAAALTSRFIGGLHVNRNQKGDYNEQPTLQPIDGDTQKHAMNLLNSYVFAENALVFPKRYYTHLTDTPYNEFGRNSYSIEDTLSSIQTAALRRLFSPAVLDRVANNEFKIADPAKALTMPTLFHSVSANVWSELPSHKNVSALRRRLQRAHLDTLITMYVSPASGTPEDAKMLAWDQLKHLKGQLAAAQGGSYDDYTRVHLAESMMRIDRALNAQQTIGTASAPRALTLQDLLGGKTPSSNN